VSGRRLGVAAETMGFWLSKFVADRAKRARRGDVTSLVPRGGRVRWSAGMSQAPLRTNSTSATAVPPFGRTYPLYGVAPGARLGLSQSQTSIEVFVILSASAVPRATAATALYPLSSCCGWIWVMTSFSKLTDDTSK
jgi:hypothetical protein